jgi:hypothetical protein
MVVELVPNKAAIMLSITLKSNAHQNPSTTNPGTILPISIMIRALITRRKNPSVTMVTGIVRKTSTGRINVLRIAKAIATMSAVIKFSTCTPRLRSQEVIRTAQVYKSKRKITFMALKISVSCFP